MFKIKICGITKIEDALFTARTGADAIGLNFYPKSKRFLALNEAVDISAALKELEMVPRLVGVFVNESPTRIRSICEQAQLDIVQLHGDETPDLLMDLKGLSVVKAFRCKNQIDDAIEWLTEAAEQHAMPDAVLLDAFHPDEYGGTGESIDLDTIRRQIDRLNGLHWVLAGGLTPDNVGAAIKSIAPGGVDTASGVESAPGEKCHSKTERFVRQAQYAFAATQNRT